MKVFYCEDLAEMVGTCPTAVQNKLIFDKKERPGYKEGDRPGTDHVAKKNQNEDC